jgi:hypothetical protein
LQFMLAFVHNVKPPVGLFACVGRRKEIFL